jgi:cytochrome c-type biogenesis protein CcmE
MAVVAERPRQPLLGLRPIQWIMVGIVVLAVALGAFALRGGAMVSYASIDEAKAVARPVQVFGFLYSKGAYDDAGRWTFDIQGESGEVLTVVYPHAKPGNFDQAISVVAIGAYDQQEQHFVADKLLVKCPSKYQEQATG